MPSVFLSGSALLVPGTPRNLGTINVGGNYVAYMDAGNMADGDELEIRIGNAIGVGTPALQYDAAYADRQAVQIKNSEPFSVLHQGLFDAVMTAGGARWFPFEVQTIS